MCAGVGARAFVCKGVVLGGDTVWSHDASMYPFIPADIVLSRSLSSLSLSPSLPPSP